MRSRISGFLFLFFLFTLPIRWGAAAELSLGHELGIWDDKETILSYDSEVEVLPSTALVVRETIRVLSAMKEIQRGIYRDFPLRSAVSPNVSFTVKSATIDGAPAKYTTERIAGGIRVLLGDKYRFLPPGEHTFVLVYETTGHIHIGDDHAELGWNVTGDQWNFPIESASCRVTVPHGGTLDDVSAWLGAPGSAESPVDIDRPEENAAVFTAREEITPRRHFTVAVKFPAHLVRDPSKSHMLRMALAVLLVVGYFAGTWLLWGRDPAPGTVIPLFYPPEVDDRGFMSGGRAKRVLSPAAASYIINASFLDIHGFASIFVSLAAKGYCRLTKSAGGKFSITPLPIPRDQEAALPEEELVAHFKLERYAGGQKPFVVSPENSEMVRDIHSRVVDVLAARYAPLWQHNLLIQVVGWLVVVPFAAVLMNKFGGSYWDALLPPAILAGVVFLLRKQIAYFRARSINSINPANVAMQVLIVAAVLAVRLRSLSLAATVGNFLLNHVYSLSIATVLLVAVPMFFCPVMKAPSRRGRRLLDAIEGLRLYIGTAERHRLIKFNPPEKTPEVFERLLPYAVAFRLEDTWCGAFATVLSATPPKNLAASDSSLWRGSWRRGIWRSDGGFAPFGNSLATSANSTLSSGGSFLGGGGRLFSGGGGAGSGGGGGGGGGW